MDDEHVPMTMSERTAWAYLVTILVTSGTYFAIIAGRLPHEPVERISWVAPMLWAMGASFIGTIACTVVGTTVGTVVAAVRTGRADGICRPEPGGVSSDVRDEEIGRLGSRASMAVIGAGFGGALVLAMIEAHPFWVGNLIFLFGTLGGVVETVTKIRLYRRGF